MSDSTDAKVGMVVGALALPVIVAFAGYIILSHSFVASQVWAWYAVPAGLPAIAWKSWAGVMMMRAALFTTTVIPKTDDKNKTSGWSALGNLLAPWFVLLMAWVIR